MKSTTVYLTEEQIQKLKEVSAKTRIKMAELIRQGIDLILEEKSLSPVLSFPPLRRVK